MKTTLKKELPIVIIVLIPFAYLFFIWHSLPDEVPIHWNMHGKTDRYGSKKELLIIPFLLPFLIYVLLLIIPVINPKGKLNNMGNKLQNLKLLITTFMSVLALYILYSAKQQTLENPNYLITAIGILFIILGNYFKTIKPNYFIGVRTPWTLENEVTWKETHKLAGKLWFLGGLLIVIFSLLFNTKTSFILSLTITLILIIVPLFYSYLLYRRNIKST